MPWTESLLGGSTTAPWIDVKTYGAKGDGVTDDTAAIQAALDGRPSTGAVIYFPAGTYLTTASLNIKNPRIMLVGAGTDITLIKAGANIATALIANASGIQGFTVYMRDFTVDGNKATFATGNKGIDFTNCTAATFERIYVQNCVGDGIYATGANATAPRFLFC